MSIKLLKSTAVVSLFTLLSRISGLVRDVVFVRFFGDSASADAFLVAFRIPNFLRRLFAEGAFSQAFVPVLGEYKTTKEQQEVRQLVARVSGTLGLVLFIITAIGVIAAPVLVMLFAPGYTAEDKVDQFTLTTEMLRWTFPYILFISLTALAGGVLNTYGKFAVPAFTPVLLNLVMIAAILWLSPYFEHPVLGLAVGVFLAGLVQLLYQLPAIAKLKLLTFPRVDTKHPGVRKIARLMLPSIIASSAQQINLLIDSIIVTFLVTGSVTWLYVADRLVEFPLGVFGIAIATVILPSLSAKFASDDPEKFRRTLDWGVRWALVIGTPAMLGLIVLAAPLVMTIFQRGQFDQHAAQMTQWALMMYSIGLLGFIYVKVLAPGYLARQDTKTPMWCSIKSIVIKIIISLIIVPVMLYMGLETAHLGLAFTTALAAILNASMLYFGLIREGYYKPLPGWMAFIAKVGLASCAMVAVLLYFDLSIATWGARSFWERVTYLALEVGVGVATYFGCLFMLRLDFIALLKHAEE